MNVAFLCSTRYALRLTQDVYRSALKTNVVVALSALEVTPQMLALVWRGLRTLLATGTVTEGISSKCHYGKNHVQLER